MPYICTRHEPQYEVGSLRSSTDNLHNQFKLIPIPQIHKWHVRVHQEIGGSPTEK